MRLRSVCAAAVVEAVVVVLSELVVVHVSVRVGHLRFDKYVGVVSHNTIFRQKW